MPNPRTWTTPQTATVTEANGVVTASATTGGPGFNLGADLVQTTTFQSFPPASASVFAPASYSVNTASVATVVQNTLGYDALFTGYAVVANPTTNQLGASVASFLLGVGPSTLVAPVAVVTGYTASSVGTVAASGELFTFPAYVPNGYYYSWQATQANGASVNVASFTILATPV